MLSIKSFKGETPKSTIGIIVSAVGIVVEAGAAILGFIGAKKTEKIHEDDINKIADKTAEKLAAKMEADIKKMIEEEAQEDDSESEQGD